LSHNPERTSHMVAKAMQERGYRIIPVNPTAAGKEILGETCYASLKDIPEQVDLVNVFAAVSIRLKSLSKRFRSEHARSGCSWASTAKKRLRSLVAAV